MSNILGVRVGTIVSSVLVGNGAKGCVTFFSKPLGAEIPRIGDVPRNLFPTYTSYTTSLLQSDRMGAALGDVQISGVTAKLNGSVRAHLDLEEVVFRLRVASRVVIECGVCDLPLTIEPSITIDATHVMEGELELAYPVITVEPILVRVALLARMTYYAEE